MSSEKSPEQEVSGGINVQRANDVALRAEDDIVGRDKVTITHNYFNDPKSRNPEIEGQTAKAPATDQPAVVPQGLQSFGEDAKGFFLRLLPPPYHQDGLPESLHFWKRQIEQTDADETFRVGVIYGMSGCGKSSWVKAGLLPRLEGVTSVYVEAIPDGTPQRLLAALRKRCPWLGGDAASLAEGLQRKDRIPPTTKVLLVLDQFEQWLHGRREADYGELLDALRLCDGARVQCVLLIRSDFVDLLQRFLDHLNVRLEQGKNWAMFDLFDQRHARNVLTLFGQAYDRFPKSGELTADQERFRNQAVDELADETGRIVCVRLSLFAEMLKRREWIPATLRQIGGTSGVGFAFLEENFSAKDAPRQYQRHEAAARAVLEQLLPAVGKGTDIKGAMQSEDALRSRSGYERRAADFAELLKILNQELRLITPTAPVETTVDQDPPPADASVEAPVGPKYYQLTHDYLVPSLRDWLTDGQKSTWRGRAFLLLAERTAEWTSKKRQVRSLPGPLEYLRIMAAAVLPTRHLRRPLQRLEPAQRGLMWAATRWFGTICVLLLLVAAGLGGWVLDGNEKYKAKDFADKLNAQNDATEHQRLVDEQLPRYRRWIVAELDGRVRQKPGKESSDGSRETVGRQRADEAIALLRLGALDEARAAFGEQTREDPEALTQFIGRAQDRGVTAEHLAQLYERATTARDDATRFAATLTLGGLDEKTLDGDGRRELAKRLNLSEVYATNPSSAIHGATGWTLRQWKIPEPPIEPRPSPQGSHAWMVTKQGLTLVRIPAGTFVRKDPEKAESKPQTVKLTRDFWLSDREISVGLFREFFADQEYAKKYPEEALTEWKGEMRWARSARVSDPAAPPTAGLQNSDGEAQEPVPAPLHPVQQVSWDEAVKFCNWLSRREYGDSVVCCYSRGQPSEGAKNATSDWKLDKMATSPLADGSRMGAGVSRGHNDDIFERQ